MAFGKPTRYLQLDISKVAGGAEAWDRAVREASEEYKVLKTFVLSLSKAHPVYIFFSASKQGRVHNLCCDNCHSHVSMALNLMEYGSSTSHNMFQLAIWSFLFSKYTGIKGFLLTWVPFLIVITITVVAILL